MPDLEDPSQAFFALVQKKTSNPSLNRAADAAIGCDRCGDGHLRLPLRLEETLLGPLRILLRGRFGRVYNWFLTLVYFRSRVQRNPCLWLRRIAIPLELAL